MPFNWNVFRILADLSHTLSKLILIWAIHSNKSAEGVSLITQILYLVVFITRYLFISWGPNPFGEDWHLLWNDTLRIFYIASSAYIVLIMMKLFARTREREKAWKMGIISVVGSLLLSPFAMMAFVPKAEWAFHEYLITFSLLLESVCVLPQLLLLRQTSVPTVLDSFYLVTLGAYRAFYLMNWLVQAITRNEHEVGARRHPDPLSVICGLIQTALYIDFALVYWTRQRVKLRNGAVVDSDDMSKSWLIKRFIGNRGGNNNNGGGDEDEDEEVFRHPDDEENARQTRNAGRRSWGARGISVSADEGLHDGAGDLEDPAHFEDEDDEHETTDTSAKTHSGQEQS